MFFFTNRWYKKIPERIRPPESSIDKLESFRRENSIPQDHFAMLIGTSDWAVAKLQRSIYNESKYMYPHLSEKEHWRNVILSRIEIKRKSNLMMLHDPGSNPLTNLELDEIIVNLNANLESFSSFSDVIFFLIDLDEKENRFDTPYFSIINGLRLILFDVENPL